jgi:hypothetical protein
MYLQYNEEIFLVPKKQALPITEEEEDTLWSKKVLGDEL